MPIIGEGCELVKLCHINRSGPVVFFFETQCIYSLLCFDLCQIKM